ncbi:hypothetical protein PVW48_17075 [Dinoroseobacter sp. PD6]|uniref:hypothetical protein n=1 Tax=Dinoroseobacter sp. PD6 TaxID=3028384 RepID=UPI00237B287B|nr:hypothetical protein [Dinoroseobacter sp. PD6]MDD9718478.1 hypothetical protein [Dinoroseobacter sp. PD6]
MKMQAFFVIFAVMAATLGLAAGLFAVSVGETAAPAVALAVISGVLAALPASWFALRSGAYA